ncbi:MAG: hypothetical protein F4Y00_06325 [Bacteroidetes bacterium SB0662_bin_6]|nr:hypothetical protein [Bacteroidetes bacterium SB0668_bin_1]MYE04568.1 hypothetical protein [Bacteroidetes bacterium SB0662_bin_6]
MLIRSLASNYLKSILRSRFAELNLAAKILAIVFIWMPLYLYATAAGLFIDLVFDTDMPAIASGGALYFLVFWSVLDVFFRPRISLPLFPYLATPITRPKLALFYQATSIFGKINFVPFLFVLAFWFRNFLLKDVSFAWVWLLLFLSLSACFHLLTNLLRMSLSRRYLPMLCTLLFVVALAAMEWRYDIPTFAALSSALFEATLGGAVWPLAIVLAAGATVLYISTGQVVRALYVDDTALSRPRRKVAGKGVDRSFTDGMLSFEWKMIRRNKRPRVLLFTIPYMVLYGIYMVVTSEVMSDMSGISYILEILNLSLALLFTPFLSCMLFIGSALNFRSVFYDGLMSRPLLTDTILNTVLYIANIMLLGYFGIIAAVFLFMQNFATLPLAGYLLLYCMGIKYIMPYIWVFEARRIELNGNVFDNVNFHFGQNWWISALCAVSICFLPPLLIALLPGIHWGGIAIGALGLAGLLLRSRWIAAITKNLEKKRYVLMEEFRKG